MADDKKTDGSWDDRQKRVLKEQSKKDPKKFKDTWGTPPRHEKPKQ